MAISQWQTANGAVLPEDLTGQFSICAPPKTDIWRRSDTDDTFNAPYIYTSIAPASFKRMSVTLSGQWKTQFDQGGFVIAFPRQGAPWRWIKAGIEYFEGAPALGVVGTDRYSDWSLSPMAPGEQHATFEAVKDGSTLWVYALKDGKRQPLREVKWAFVDFEDGQGEMQVGVYAAKPTPDEGESKATIDVTFSGFELETRV
ncbi:hypothetical protein GGR56DRAFT_611716 [Xylariaceae sp. FL0804]|nr:hypothetical protein GGR56DRAFT_611716 [Xylariaceae sp. FL0804]